jgi:hypothetical protein
VVLVWNQQTVPETGGGLASATWSPGGFGPSRVVDSAQSFGPLLGADGRGDVALTYFQGPRGFGDWTVRPAAGAFGEAQPLPASPAFVIGRGSSAVTLGDYAPTRLYDVALG